MNLGSNGKKDQNPAHNAIFKNMESTKRLLEEKSLKMTQLFHLMLKTTKSLSIIQILKILSHITSRLSPKEVFLLEEKSKYSQHQKSNCCSRCLKKNQTGPDLTNSINLQSLLRITGQTQMLVEALLLKVYKQ